MTKSPDLTHELARTKKDFDLQWFSGTGGGGQHRNKHQNCCRIRDKITGLAATATEHRERPANQKLAFLRLVARLRSHYATKLLRDKVPSDEVRVYKEPRNEVLDHASGERMQYKDAVIKGNIGPMVEARKTVRSTDIITR